MSASTSRARPLGFPGSTSSSHDEEEWRVASTTRGHDSEDSVYDRGNNWDRASTNSSNPLRSLSPSTSSFHSHNSLHSFSSNHPASSPSGLAPRVHRVVNDAMQANGLSFHHDEDSSHTPTTASSPSSITDKLRHLKLKSRAGRGTAGTGGQTGGMGLGMDSAARNTRAASAFVRRAPSEDELDHQMAERGYELQRPASNMSHYPTGSQTPTVQPRNPFGDRAVERTRRETEEQNGYEPVSTNSSYENLGSGSQSALSSLKGRRERRTPGVDSVGKGAAPSSPSSNNSSSSFSSAFPNRHSTSPMPAPGASSAEPVVARRQRFTSEPVQPHAHLQIHSPAPVPAHSAHQTAFGAARHAHHASLSLSSNSPGVGGSGQSSYAQHYASLMDAEEQLDDLVSSPAPYSNAFDSSSSHSHSPHQSVHHHSHYTSAPAAHHAEERLLGGTARVQRDQGEEQQPRERQMPASSRNADERPIGGGSAASLRFSDDRPLRSADDRPLGGSAVARAHAHVRQDSYGGAASGSSDGGYHSPMAPDESPASGSSFSGVSGNGGGGGGGMHTPLTSSKDYSGAKWDLTPAQAREMGMDFSLPPPMSSSGSHDGGSSNGRDSSSSSSSAQQLQKKRPKPLVRAAGTGKPSLSIPASPGGLSAYPSISPATPGSSPSLHPGSSPAPLLSPARPRNPRVSTVGGGAGGAAGGGSVMGSPSGGGGVGAQEEGNYVASCDLLPLSGASSEIAPTLKALQSSDWAVRFDALTTLRRLIVHHSGLLSSHTKSLIRDLRAEVNSLRSSLAKNSLMALSDAFLAQPRAFEVELEQIGPSVLKRAGEPSGFLRDEAHRALMSMLTHCSDRFTLPFLLNASSTGTKIIKTMACVYLDRAVEVYAARSNGGAVLQANKEWPRLLKAIGIFSSDAAVESRTHSRWSLIRLAKFMGVDELERTMKRLLPAAHYHAVTKVLSKGMDQLSVELSNAPSSGAMNSPPSAHSIQSSPSSKRVSSFSQAGATPQSFALVSPPLASPDSSEYGEDASSSTPQLAAGLESLTRKRRPKPPANTGSAAASTSNSLDSTTATPILSSAASAVAMAASVVNGWSSLKGSKSPAPAPTVPGGYSAIELQRTSSSTSSAAPSARENIFDLDNPEFNSAGAAPASATSSVSSNRGAATAKRRPTAVVSAADTEKLQGILGELASADWRTRMGGVEKLVNFLRTSPAAVGPNIVKIYDLLCQRINDMHGKVNVAALQALTQIIPLTKAHLSGVLSTFIPALSQQLASTNPGVRTLCQSGLDLLLATLESPTSTFTKDIQSAVIQPFAQVALFENVKIRPMMIEKLTGVIVACADACDAQGQPPALSTFKSSIPVAYSLCEETRVEIKTPLLKFAQVLHAILGSSCWDEKVCMQFHISNSQVNKFKAIIGASTT